MASLFLPPALRKPEIIDTPGVVEFYADLGVVVGGEETVRINLAVERDSGTFELCGRIFMPRQGFRQSLLWAVADHGLGMARH